MKNHRQVKSSQVKKMVGDNPVVKLKALISTEMSEMRDHLLGKVLTIIDASISDQEQRKCMKDLIRDVFFNQENTKWFYHKIGKIILEFNSKFAKVSMTPEELEYFETGEIGRLINNQDCQSVVERQYFD